MDADTLNRREKRHYRQIVDGNIVYSNKPVDEDNDSNQATKKAKDKAIVQKIISPSAPIDKKELMNKVLDNMSDIINPDLDIIADTIYDQLKEQNVDVAKKIVKETVSKHYRATSSSGAKENSTSDDSSNLENPIDRDKLKLVVDDLYTQIENENKTESINAENKKVAVEKVKEEFKSKGSKKEEADTDNETHSSRTTRDKPKNKVEDKVEPKKSIDKNKKDNIKELLSDDEDMESSDDDDEDDLGLKF